jgi:UDP-N-acetylglucosamine 3-dehydrogenase
VLCRAASAVGRRVFVAENYVYKPIAEHLQRVIRAGDLGDVTFVTLNATKHQRMDGWRADRTLSGGGALFEGGAHWVSFAANIGLEVTAVCAQQVGNADGADRSALVVFRYATGAPGTLAYSWELRAPFRGLRLSKVQGTLGAVTFESNGLAAVTTGARRSIRLLLRDPLGYRSMLEDFGRAIRCGEPPAFTVAMAQRDLQRLERLTACSGPLARRAEQPDVE